MNAIVFNTIGSIKRAAVIFDGTVFKLEMSEGGEDGIGDIYMGRVEKVIDSMQAAFVDIGLDINGYLQKDEIKGGYGKSRISDLIRTGDEIAVQIKKRAEGGKGPKLTGKLSIQKGGLVFYDDDDNRIAVSNKVENPKSIRRLKELAYKMHKEPFGMILRTHAEELSDEAIKRDYGNLQAEWKNLFSQIAYARAPKRIYARAGFAVEKVTNNSYRGIDKIVFDCSEDMESVLGQCSGIVEEMCELRDVSEGLNTFALYPAEKAIEESVKKKLWLPSGGNIIIEETEALTSIDVNSAKSSSGGGVSKTNSEAAAESARQIMLRNLSGMILIDFLDSGKRAKKEICEKMEGLFEKYDNRKFDIYGFTRAGLFEMSREKKGASVRRLLMVDRTFEKPAYTMGRIERELARIKSETSMDKLEIRTDCETASWLEEIEYGKIAGQRYGQFVKIRKNSDMKPGEFKIIYL